MYIANICSGVGSNNNKKPWKTENYITSWFFVIDDGEGASS